MPSRARGAEWSWGDAACLRQGRFGEGARGFFPLGVFVAGGIFCAQAAPFRARGADGRRRWISSPSGLLSLPAGPRRAPPAPAQGTCPLRIPLAAARFPNVTTNAGRLLRVSRPASYSFPRSNQKRNKARLPPTRGAGARRSYAAALVVDTIDDRIESGVSVSRRARSITTRRPLSFV